MAWIELHDNLPTHKKTRRLTRALGLSVPADIPTVVGHLCVLWLWTMEHALDGRLDGFDAQDVADAAGWTGDAALFLSAMIDCGFIDSTEDGINIHDWNVYAGRFIEYKEKLEKTKRRNRERVREYRERKRAEKEQTSELTPDVPDSLVDEGWKKVASCYEKQIGMLPMGAACDDLQFYYDQLGADVVCEAIIVTNKAAPNNPFKYLEAILKKWCENNINTIEKAKAYTKDLERKLKARKGINSPQAEQGAPPAIDGQFF